MFNGDKFRFKTVKRVLETDGGDGRTALWMCLMSSNFKYTWVSTSLFSFSHYTMPYSKPLVPILFMENKRQPSELCLKTYPPLFPFVHATLQPIWRFQSLAWEDKGLGTTVRGAKRGRGGGGICFQHSGYIHSQKSAVLGIGCYPQMFLVSSCPESLSI